MSTPKLKNLELSNEKSKNLSLNSKNLKIENKSKFLVINPTSLSKKYYQNIIAYDLLLKQNLTSVMQLACIDKIVLNTGSKIYVNDKKSLLFSLAALELLSGQKPQLTSVRKSIANFKIRQDQIIGCKVDLRGNQMFNFLDKLSKIIFPRIRDHSKKILVNQNSQDFQLSKKNTKKSTYNFGFQNMMLFPELENHFELVESFRGMNCTFVLSNSNKNVISLLLSGFQLPIFV